MGTRRMRRTAEDARKEILDAAEVRLRNSGPSALRLQQVAADVGVSHPAVLHHFGNRETLIRAVVTRATERLETELIRLLGDAPGSQPGTVLARTHEMLVQSGHARTLAWLALSGEPIVPKETRLRSIAEVVHQRRLATNPSADLDDTTFRLLLVSMAMIGDAVIGRQLRASAGLADNPETETAFYRWLTRLIAPAAAVSTSDDRTPRQ